MNSEGDIVLVWARMWSLGYHQAIGISSAHSIAGRRYIYRRFGRWRIRRCLSSWKCGPKRRYHDVRNFWNDRNLNPMRERSTLHTGIINETISGRTKNRYFFQWAYAREKIVSTLNIDDYYYYQHQLEKYTKHDFIFCIPWYRRISHWIACTSHIPIVHTVWTPMNEKRKTQNCRWKERSIYVIFCACKHKSGYFYAVNATILHVLCFSSAFPISRHTECPLAHWACTHTIRVHIDAY